MRLSDGRIIVPSAFHKYAGGGEYSSFDHRGTACFFFSDDDGETWRESQNSHSFPGRHSLSGLQETGLVERLDGSLWALCRTDMGRQYELFSFDRGLTWTVPAPSVFTSPCSPLSIKRHPGSKALMAIWNPVPFSGPFSLRRKKMYRHRTPLVYSLSFDDGLSWADPVTVEDDSERGYCYTAVHFTDDAVLLAYCAGSEALDGDQLARLRIRRFAVSK